MNEPTIPAQPEPSAQCPACKKTLVTRSARLCVFCGENLPEALLRPLAEVRREEQSSRDAVQRVLTAYEAREAEMVERSKHITHAGLLFEDQLREVLFPDAEADQWALHEIQRTLKLPDDDFDARGHKRHLDNRVRKLASSLAGRFGRLDCKIATDQAGHLSARLMDKAISVRLETQFGKNAQFKDGAAHSFRSYAIRAEARVPALNRADGAAQRLRMLCMVAGILGVSAGFVWLAYTLTNALGLEMFHHLWLHEPGVTVALLLGAWLGGKAGHWVAARLEQRTLRRAEAQGVLPRAESLWKALVEEIEEITKEYEVL